MSKKKRSLKVVPTQGQPPRLPVLHGMCFTTFIDEARSIGNEVQARREYDTDVVEYLTQKGLLDEFGKWREAKRAPQQTAR